ncbi:MAG: hypothetical protein EOO10_01095 [Chitinophagaceae bacterium]|nr:MAG: hypothetical protein EOO10_01095 [Chitinophagaceae bacterium]
MRAHFLFSLLFVFLFSSCDKETEEFQGEPLADYLPLQTGDYITYRIDSTIFINFGANTEVRSYQEKHQVDAQLTDNLGRPSYRVFRFTRDTNGTMPWKPVGSYFITSTDKAVELVEDNLRFLKLSFPVKEGNSWKGNRYLPYDPYGLSYEFSNDDAMVDWEYQYTDVSVSKTLNGKTYANTITIEQIKDSSNMPIVSSGSYGFVNYSTDTYAKGIGLIQQEIRMFEYQPPTSPRPGLKGFGIKRTIIDHN